MKYQKILIDIALVDGDRVGHHCGYIEVILIKDNSLFHVDTAIPSIPNGMFGLQGAKLPNGDLLVCGGKNVLGTSDEYMLFKQGSNQWKKVGTMKRARWLHSSVCFDGDLYTIGGKDSFNTRIISHHEQFSFEGGAKDKKELPYALYGYTATIFDYHKMLICGGRDDLVGNQFISHKIKRIRFMFQNFS